MRSLYSIQSSYKVSFISWLSLGVLTIIMKWSIISDIFHTCVKIPGSRRSSELCNILCVHNWVSPVCCSEFSQPQYWFMANLVSIKTCKNDDQSGLKPMTQWRPIDGVISNWCQPGYMMVLARCAQTDYISEPWVQSPLITLSNQGPSHHSSHQTVSRCHECHESHVTQCQFCLKSAIPHIK